MYMDKVLLTHSLVHTRLFWDNKNIINQNVYIYVFRKEKETRENVGSTKAFRDAAHNIP